MTRHRLNAGRRLQEQAVVCWQCVWEGASPKAMGPLPKSFRQAAVCLVHPEQCLRKGEVEGHTALQEGGGWHSGRWALQQQRTEPGTRDAGPEAGTFLQVVCRDPAGLLWPKARWRRGQQPQLIHVQGWRRRQLCGWGRETKRGRVLPAAAGGTRLLNLHPPQYPRLRANSHRCRGRTS